MVSGQVWFVVANWTIAMSCLTLGLFKTATMTQTLGRLMVCGLHAVFMDAVRVPSRVVFLVMIVYGTLYAFIALLLVTKLMAETHYDKYFSNAALVRSVKMRFIPVQESLASCGFVRLRVAEQSVPPSRHSSYYGRCSLLSMQWSFFSGRLITVTWYYWRYVARLFLWPETYVVLRKPILRRNHRAPVVGALTAGRPRDLSAELSEATALSDVEGLSMISLSEGPGVRTNSTEGGTDPTLMLAVETRNLLRAYAQPVTNPIVGQEAELNNGEVNQFERFHHDRVCEAI